MADEVGTFDCGYRDPLVYTQSFLSQDPDNTAITQDPEHRDITRHSDGFTLYIDNSCTENDLRNTAFPDIGSRPEAVTDQHSATTYSAQPHDASTRMDSKPRTTQSSSASDMTPSLPSASIEAVTPGPLIDDRLRPSQSASYPRLATATDSSCYLCGANIWFSNLFPGWPDYSNDTINSPLQTTRTGEYLLPEASSRLSSVAQGRKRKRTQADEGLWKCPWPACEKTFSSRQDIREHEKSHQNRPHQCSICEKAFLSTKDLKRHQDTVHSTSSTS